MIQSVEQSFPNREFVTSTLAADASDNLLFCARLDPSENYLCITQMGREEKNLRSISVFKSKFGKEAASLLFRKRKLENEDSLF